MQSYLALKISLILVLLLSISSALENPYPLRFGTSQALKIPISQIILLRAKYAANRSLVLRKESPQFLELTKSWNMACTNRPYLIMQPSSYREARDIMRLTFKYSQPFVIRSGGHDFECASTTRGVLVSLHQLRSITPIYHESRIVVQAGADLLDVHNAVAGSGYEVVTGECPTVGISGFTLGGGINLLLSKRYGIGAQNVLEVKAITADGKLVTATWINEYKDLLWGLLGYGGGRLAFVVQFTLKLHHYPERLYNLMQLNYNLTKVQSREDYDLTKRMVHKWVEIVNKVNQKYPASGNYIGVNSRLQVQILALCRACSLQSLYEPFLAENFPHQTVKFKRLTYDQFYSNIMLPSFKTIKISGRFSTFSAFSKDQDASLLDLFLEEKFRLKNRISFFVQDTFNMVKDASHTSYPFQNARFQVTLDYYSKLDNQRTQFKEQQNSLQSKIEKHPSYLGCYVNYLNGAIKSDKWYYRQNWNKLKQIKQKYDPENRFTRPKYKR